MIFGFLDSPAPDGTQKTGPQEHSAQLEVADSSAGIRPEQCWDQDPQGQFFEIDVHGASRQGLSAELQPVVIGEHSLFRQKAVPVALFDDSPVLQNGYLVGRLNCRHPVSHNEDS